MLPHVNVLTGKIIGAAIEVHRSLGPGLLESAYHQCLARELELGGITFKFDWPLPLEYKGLRIKKGYRMDLLVEECVIVGSEVDCCDSSDSRSSTTNVHALTEGTNGSLNELQRDRPEERHSSEDS